MIAEIERLVLVEDDPDDCFLFRKALADITDSLQVQFVTDCDLLISTLDSFLPQLIFMDINMPKKSGFICVDEIRGLSRHASLPIIMYSCASEPLQIQKAYAIGAHLYLLKPDSYDELVESLQKILGLDWSVPDLIRQQHWQQGAYLPF
jgi:CheY-like chemotaxis protein